MVPLTITVTPAQRTALKTMADVQHISISAMIRQFIEIGLATSALYVLTALIEITITRCTDAEESEGTRIPQGGGHHCCCGRHETQVCRAPAPRSDEGPGRYASRCSSSTRECFPLERRSTLRYGGAPHG